jgi:multiple sugar transport system substrate-binding protein
MLNRALLLVLALLLMAASATAQEKAEDAAPAPAATRTKIEFWHGMSSAQGRCVNEIAEIFNKSQERYQVNAVYQGNYNTLSQKLIASCYAKRSPALAQMYPGWASRFYRYGYLVPVEKFVAKDPTFREKDIPDFYPVMINENTLKHPDKPAPELVTLPFNKSVYVLYVNQTMMEKVGWKEPPKTWSEFRKLAAAMTITPPGSSTPTTYGFAARPFIEDLTVQAFAAGVPLVEESTGRVNVNSPEVIEALEFLRSLVAGEGTAKVGYVESAYLNSPFGSEKIGMYISSTASFPFNDSAVGNKFIWRAYPVPVKDGAAAGKTLMQGTNVGIFAGLTEEEEQGAWEFVKFLTGTEMTAKWAKDTGYMPVRRSAITTAVLGERIAKDPSYGNAISTLERATYEPRVAWWESVRSTLSREVEAVLLGRKKAPDAMATAERQVLDTIATAD